MSKANQPPSPTSRAADALIRAVESRFREGLPAQAFLRRFASEPERAAILDQLIAAVVADRPDATRWLAWFAGGPAISHAVDPAEMPEFLEDGLKHPRLRQTQSAGRMAVEATENANRLDRQIAAGEAHVAELRRKRDRADEMARAAVAYAFFDLLDKKLYNIFATGPAYTLVRAVSNKVVGDQARNSAHGTQRDRDLALVHAQLAAGQVRETLAQLVGDAEFEADLYAAIREVTERHRPRAQAQSAEKRKLCRLAAEGDAEAVVAGCGLPNVAEVDERPFELGTEPPPAARPGGNEKEFVL